MDAVVPLGWHVVTKRRADAKRRFRYTGPRTGQRGRPKTYDGKVHGHDLSRLAKVEATTLERAPQVAVDTQEWSHGSRPRWRRVVVLVWDTAQGQRHHALPATTELACAPAEVLRLYQGRFPLEFLFRAGKPFAGLTEGQARHAAAREFPFNAALATVSATRAAMAQAQGNAEPFVFSLATHKQRAFQERFRAAISTQ